MNLLEAVVEANHRALAGEAGAEVRIVDFSNSLPIAMLSCIDPRLNALLPDVLGIPKEDFIWLRNAGNIITGPLSSTLRSLALAVMLRNAREIIILGHTDCLVRSLTVAELTSRFQAYGIERHQLPDNLVEYFGLFASENQNVMKGVALVRQSPIIPARVPVHGLLVHLQTGKLEWLVNGYQELSVSHSIGNEVPTSAPPSTPSPATSEPSPAFAPISATTPTPGWMAKVTPWATEPEPPKKKGIPPPIPPRPVVKAKR